MRPPVPGEVLGSRRESEPLLGGAPRRQMVRLMAGCAVLGVVTAGLLVALADGPGWAVGRAGVGVAVVAFTIGWRVLRVRHRGGRLP